MSNQPAGKLTKTAAVTCAVAAAAGTIFNYGNRASGEVTSMAPKLQGHQNSVELRTWCVALVVVAICMYATLLALSVMLPSAGIEPSKVITSACRNVKMIMSVIMPCFFRIIKSALFISFSLFVFTIKVYLYFVFGLILFLFSLLFLVYYLFTMT